MLGSLMIALKMPTRRHENIKNFIFECRSSPNIFEKSDKFTKIDMPKIFRIHWNSDKDGF
jgi:hypothetical protein